ncbi:hypothetical protein HRW18_00390 [Streptomyces lunaelactis]|uniref:hypothetical protein n=1 Tax=Streptomyces lunaelactis TaxID=1535768 RepID=UPI0015849094|nr:hypothetical protein [Streptomyces lunaelactis]NUK06503.1 hypothetical protein [Streptomyces lunaelactis]NUL08231.1 hypothetical protein [Streptomyces lunaelactis]NUL24355.1 hypothetical protein [Streptomyces lunaelactis]
MSEATSYAFGHPLPPGLTGNQVPVGATSARAPFAGTRLPLASDRSKQRRIHPQVPEGLHACHEKAPSSPFGFTRTATFGSFCPDEGDVEVRCMLAFSLRIGNHFIAADHGGHSRAEVLELTRKWLLR